jgi:hypothetical protein
MYMLSHNLVGKISAHFKNTPLYIIFYKMYTIRKITLFFITLKIILVSNMTYIKQVHTNFIASHVFNVITGNCLSHSIPFQYLKCLLFSIEFMFPISNNNFK